MSIHRFSPLHCVSRATFGVALALALGGTASATELVSVSSAGAQGNQQSRYPAISANGRFVSFQSDASTLVANDSNGWADIFLRDRWSGETIRISVTPQGAEGASFSDISAMSFDAGRIVFASYAALVPNAPYQGCYLYERRTGALSVVNLRTDGSFGTACREPHIDLLGTRVAFSTGDDLDPADDDGRADIYVRNLDAGSTQRVTRGLGGVGSDGASYAPRLSGDGSRVVYASEATNLVPGDSNGVRDVFVTAVDSGETFRVSVGPGGVQANAVSDAIAAINWDGSLLAFSSNASSLPDPGEFSESTVYLRVPGTDQTVAMSLPTDPSLAREGFNDEPDFSATGQYLVFASTDDLLLDDDTSGGIYVVDLVEGLIARVSQRVSESGSGNHIQPRISADGTGIVWVSTATNLVANDSNGYWDVFYARNPLHPQVFGSDFED